MTNLLTLPGKLSKFGHPPVEWLPEVSTSIKWNHLG